MYHTSQKKKQEVQRSLSLQKKKQANRLIGVNWSPGKKEDQNPYRSELAGIDGGYSAFAVILQYVINEGSPGTKEDRNPYRSELIGIYGGFSAFAVILQYKTNEGGIEIALDGESALNQAKDKNRYLHISQTSFNILQDIRK